MRLGPGTDFFWHRVRFLETNSSLRPSNFSEISRKCACASFTTCKVRFSICPTLTSHRSPHTALYNSVFAFPHPPPTVRLPPALPPLRPPLLLPPAPLLRPSLSTQPTMHPVVVLKHERCTYNTEGASGPGSRARFISNFQGNFQNRVLRSRVRFPKEFLEIRARANFRSTSAAILRTSLRGS